MIALIQRNCLSLLVRIWRIRRNADDVLGNVGIEWTIGRRAFIRGDRWASMSAGLHGSGGTTLSLLASFVLESHFAIALGKRWTLITHSLPLWLGAFRKTF
ncbi:MAG TPA: hypothetical protein VGC41_19785, partial [Kofleriaceae bacterium]